MSNSLAQSARITNSKEFAHVFKKGHHSQSKFWKIVASNSGNSFSRLGLAMSKKDHKKAVDRNHLKRLARETFRKNRSVLDHLDFVVMAKKSHKKNNSEITLDLLSLMKKVKNRATS
jgi:ribonuclease P protein component